MTARATMSPCCMQRSASSRAHYFLWTPDGNKKLALPAKADIDGLLDNQLIVTLNQDWKPDGLDTTFPQGSVISLNLDAVRQDPVHLKPTAIFTPSAVEFAQEVQTTRDHLVLTTLEHVQGRAYIYTPSARANGREEAGCAGQPDGGHLATRRRRRPVSFSKSRASSPRRRFCSAIPRRNR